MRAATRTMKRFTCSQVVATVFAIGWATCPMAFAVERGMQEGKRVAREIVSRVAPTIPIETVGSLVDQILDSPMTMLRSATASDDTVVLVRQEGTYTFTGVTYAQSAPDVRPVFSGAVTLLDINGMENTYDVSSLTVSDDNRIDYTMTSLTHVAGFQEETGTLVGIGEAGKAMHLVSENGQNTAARVLNFSRLTNAAQGAVASEDCAPTYYEGGGAAAAGISSGTGTVAIEPCTILVVTVVVIFVLVMCYLFCWMLR